MNDKFQKMSNEEIEILLKVFKCYYSFRKAEAICNTMYNDLVKEKRARDHLQE